MCFLLVPFPAVTYRDFMTLIIAAGIVNAEHSGSETIPIGRNYFFFLKKEAGYKNYTLTAVYNFLV